ncbi:MAG: hypothetical protein PHO14_03610 [Kiritimatiellae bacterium]|jgi:hypothetical protein|nr:hypothetical protein [Kiritimatiellia bacterium]MDD4341303.1 hypothetical protein [Kiritimatiellia bacterium]MDY0148588.1 hypothetical protein [Kiritimatiellia bacterium]
MNMTPLRLIIVPLAIILLASGCLIRSVHPWLSTASRVEAPSLLGVWHQASASEVLFVGGSPESYHLMLTDGDDVSRFTGTLHRLGDTLLLMVGPAEGDGWAHVPGTLLLRADLGDDTLALFTPDLESFASRATAADLALLPGGSQSNGYLLTGTTIDAEAFVRSQLDDPAFFSAKPVYSFRKLR